MRVQVRVISFHISKMIRKFEIIFFIIKEDKRVCDDFSYHKEKEKEKEL